MNHLKRTSNLKFKIVTIGGSVIAWVVLLAVLLFGVFQLVSFVRANDFIAVPKENRQMVEFYLDHPEWGDQQIVEYDLTIKGK